MTEITYGLYEQIINGNINNHLSEIDHELIMKDISTVRGKPQHVAQWSRIALEIAAEFAP